METFPLCRTERRPCRKQIPTKKSVKVYKNIMDILQDNIIQDTPQRMTANGLCCMRPHLSRYPFRWQIYTCICRNFTSFDMLDLVTATWNLLAFIFIRYQVNVCSFLKLSVLTLSIFRPNISICLSIESIRKIAVLNANIAAATGPFVSFPFPRIRLFPLGPSFPSPFQPSLTVLRFGLTVFSLPLNDDALSSPGPTPLPGNIEIELSESLLTRGLRLSRPETSNSKKRVTVVVSLVVKYTVPQQHHQPPQTGQPASVTLRKWKRGRNQR